MSDLRKYIDRLEAEGELIRVVVEADPVQEIAAITDQVCKQPQGGRALLFEQPCDSWFPVATNLYGSIRRVCLALGVERLGQLTERISGLLDQIPDIALAGMDRRIAELPGFATFAPCSADYDPDLLTMEPPDLTRFPFLQTWPDDGSADGFPRYITLPLVFTAGPDGSNPNCGMYRCQLRGPDQLAIRWKEGSGAAAHLQEYRRLGKRMPVAIALGGDPAITFSAMFPLPGNLDEMAFAGFLRGRALEMRACRTVPLQVPAGSELVIEGYVDPPETVTEGPFGNHTGFYSPAGIAALMRVTTIRHRPDAIIPATVVGPPPMEDCWMAKAWEAVLLALLKSLVPGVHGIHFPLEWVFHQSAVISLDNPDPDMVRETAEQLWCMPWFCSSRLLVFVNARQDVADLSRVAWSGINLAAYGRDLFYDQSGQRLALDATGSGGGRQSVSFDDGIIQRRDMRWKEYGIQ
jgi:4-hydroxy-3-polyprenylbenzoate decarboxylase